MYDIVKIMSIIPHRYPFLLVDRILEVEPRKKAVGIKNVTVNESFFQGHYPGMPIMPGVLIVEAMAQVGGIAMLSDSNGMEKVPLFGSIEDARFRKQVVPGDQLKIQAEIIKLRGTVGKVSGKAYIGDDLAAEALLTFVLVDKQPEPAL
jgi:3-hydroxyacyl-[acyl-carrier-protein] dehydratase